LVKASAWSKPPILRRPPRRAYTTLVDENNYLLNHPKPVPTPDKKNTYANAAILLAGTVNWWKLGFHFLSNSLIRRHQSMKA
jgi:hypothetical protein